MRQRLRTVVDDYPVTAFSFLAYALSRAVWIPTALVVLPCGRLGYESDTERR